MTVAKPIAATAITQTARRPKEQAAMDRLADELQALLATHQLRYVSPEDLTVYRHRCGRGFVYRDEKGRTVRTAEDLRRFKSLAIPPAWEGVRLAPEPACHLQALGSDALGRLQRRYHEAWEMVRHADKLSRLKRFAKVLPRVRARVKQDLQKPLDDPDALCALAARLIDLAHLRPGSEAALKEIGSRGATTLAPSNVNVEGDRVFLAFRGKSGKWIETAVTDQILSRRLSRLKESNRRRLFRIDREGRSFHLSCSDLNNYLQRISGAAISAKDFRTYDATSIALWRLAAEPLPAADHRRKRILAAVAKDVSQRLHNTPAIARKSYIHPAVIEAWLEGKLDGGVGERLRRSVRTSPLSSRPEAALRQFLAQHQLDGL
jgi:DNA topoisomerase-1